MIGAIARAGVAQAANTNAIAQAGRTQTPIVFLHPPMSEHALP